MFGQQNQPGANPTGGFNFGSTAPGSATGGFKFGGGATSTPAPSTQASSTGGGFTFGASQPTAASTATPFKFGSGLGANTGIPSTASTGFGFSTPSTGSASGFSFGGTTQSTAAQGTSTGGFSLGGATPSKAAQPASVPAGGFTFGGTTTKPPAATAPSGISFGGTAKPSTISAPSTGGFTFGAPSSGSGSGFTLGGAKPTTTTTQGGLTLGGTTTTPLLSSLGATSNTTTASTLPTLGTMTTQPSGGFQLSSLASTTSAQTGGFKLGGAASTTPATSAIGTGLLLGQTTGTTGLGLARTTAVSTTTSTTSTGLSLTGGLAKSTPGTLSFGTLGTSKPTPSAITTAATTTTSSVGQKTATTSAPQMTYKQLEEQINKWASELEDCERTFLEQAGQVNAWDRLLMENGEKITELNTHVESVKAEQKRLDEELDFILAQQQELEVLLKPLEEELKKKTSTPGQLQHADREREFTYGLAKDIDGQLKQMHGDLKAIIDHLNAAGSTQQENNDPIVQVAKILNAHMNSLQWIDQNAALLQRKIDEVSSLSEIRRKEQERNFRLAFD